MASKDEVRDFAIFGPAEINLSRATFGRRWHDVGMRSVQQTTPRTGSRKIGWMSWSNKSTVQELNVYRVFFYSRVVLLYAAWTGDCTTLKSLLNEIAPQRNTDDASEPESGIASTGKSISSINLPVDQDGFTLLHCAATGGHTDAVRILLDAGLGVDDVDKVLLFTLLSLTRVHTSQLKFFDVVARTQTLKDSAVCTLGFDGAVGKYRAACRCSQRERGCDKHPSSSGRIRAGYHTGSPHRLSLSALHSFLASVLFRC
eukprot:3647153-Pyramimonas_sp.AAC.1